jgi:hypothetical protein
MRTRYLRLHDLRNVNSREIQTKLFSGFYNRSLGNVILASVGATCSRDGIGPYGGGDYDLNSVSRGFDTARNLDIWVRFVPTFFSV